MTLNQLVTPTTDQKPLVIITEASSRTGLSLAKIFADAGCPLYLLSSCREKLETVDLQQATCEIFDVTDMEKFAEAIEATKNAHLPIGCFICNSDMDTFSNVDKTIDPYIKKQKFGTTIFITSVGNSVHLTPVERYVSQEMTTNILKESWQKANFSNDIRFSSYFVDFLELPMWHVETSIYHGGSNKKLKKKNEMLFFKQLAEILLWIYQQLRCIKIRDQLVAPTDGG